MSIPLQVTRSDVYKNLSKSMQKEFFDLTAKKVLPCIDNIYYSIFIKDDTNGNLNLRKLIDELCEKKLLVTVNHSEVHFFDDLLLCATGFNIYKYRLSKPELYDIFILDYLPNDDTPRILIQIRAYGLWVYGYSKMMNESFDITFRLFQEFYPEVEFSKVRENRIDYCYHTNCITNPYKAFSDANIEKSIQTEFASFGFRGHIEKNSLVEDDAAAHSLKFVKDYFSLGERKSNNIFVRIYNKALEVVELAYKSFFFAIWYENGLISLYDKFCYEYAYEKKDFAYIHKAKLQFYLDYIADDSEITAKFKKAIADDLSPLKYIDINGGYMPDVTTVINVEFETKRKFYYYSDDFIENFLKTERTQVAHQLKRLYKIIDNRSIFLDYLTSKTLCFRDDNGDYVDWWRRLRAVKLPDDLACKDKQLVRNYSKNLDKDIALKRAVNAVSTVALYNNNTDLNFQEDVTDLLSNFNDNDIFYQSYIHNKLKKYKRLKNML